MVCRAWISIAALVVLAGRMAGQEAIEDHADEDHHFHHNHIAAFLGATTPLDKERGGTTSFTVGVDYERRFTAVIGAMALADFSFGDLKREAIFAAQFAIRPIEALRLALGPGVELVEEDEIQEDGSRRSS